MSTTWKTVRVFISSTFRDMHAERDHLVKVTFPRLRQWCAERRLHLIDIDLRWGVTKEQADNGKALEVCLQEIDGSRPFFVCLLGGRYSWVPDRLPPEEAYSFRGLQAATHLSITHLEIIHSTQQSLARRADDRRPVCSHAFFYFRRPQSLPPPEAVPAAFRDEYRRTFFEEIPGRAAQLERLKQDLRARFAPLGHVYEYSAEWDPAADNPEDDALRGRLARLDALGERIESDLRAAIAEQFADHIAALGRPDPLEDERSFHEAFVEDRTRVHVPRPEVEDQLTRYVEGTDPRPLVVSGPPGSGKSALLAHWVRTHQGDAAFLLARFIGASPASTSLHRLLHNLGAELVRRFDLREGDAPAEVPADPVELRKKWPRLLEEAGRRGRVVLVLDALNQLDRSADPRRCDWLPARLPDNVRAVVSVLDHGGAADPADWLACLRYKGLPEVAVPELTDDVRRGILRELPSVFCKTLDPPQVALLLQNAATRNPLFLIVALEELRVFGSFEKLPAAIRALPGADGAAGPGAIDRSLEEMFARVLHRLQRETERRAPGLVPSLFRALASAREGLAEAELNQLLERALPGVPPPEREGMTQVVLRQVRPYLMWKGSLLDYYHRSFWKAVRAAYLDSPRLRREAHCRLADYFADQPTRLPAPNERKLAELLYHLIRAALEADRDEREHAWTPAAALLKDRTYIEAKDDVGAAVELLDNFREVVRHIPETHPDREALRLLTEAVQTDINFLVRNPGNLFQSLWNRCWWYDCSRVGAHYHAAAERTHADGAARLSSLLEGWRRNKEESSPPRRWLRSLRPPPEPLGGAQRAVLRGHENVVFAVALSADARRVASASWDRTVRVWDAASGEETACLRGHEDVVEGVAFAPDGERLISAACDRTLRVWEAASGAELARLHGHEGWVMGTAFAPDGRHAASASWDGTARYWDTAAGREVSLLRHEGRVYCVAVSPDGRLVASGGKDGIRLWNPLTGRERHHLGGHASEVRGLSFSPDGRRLASGSHDKSVRVWDVQTGQESIRLDGHRGTVYAVAFFPDGRRLASCSWDRTVRVWDTADGAQLARLEGHTDDIASVAVAADGRRLVSGGWDGTVRLWDAALAASSPRLLGHESHLTALAFSADGALLASGSADRTVQVWDAHTGERRHALAGHAGMVASLAFAGPSQLVSGSYDNTLRLWELADGTERLCLRGHAGPVLAVASSPDGRRLASGSLDQTLRLWNRETAAEIACLRGHAGRVTCVAFSPDGRRVVSGSKDRTIRVWDAASGETIACLSGHGRLIFHVGFVADDRVYSQSWDRTVRVWDVPRGECVEVLSDRWQPLAAPPAAREQIRLTADRHPETLFVSGAPPRVVARWPMRAHVAAAHPGGRTWALAERTHLSLVTLEEE